LGLAALVSFVALGRRRAEQEAAARSDEPAAA
jgi:hypothetical protein